MSIDMVDSCAGSLVNFRVSFLGTGVTAIDDAVDRDTDQSTRSVLTHAIESELKNSVERDANLESLSVVTQLYLPDVSIVFNVSISSFCSF